MSAKFKFIKIRRTFLSLGSKKHTNFHRYTINMIYHNIIHNSVFFLRDVIGDLPTNVKVYNLRVYLIVLGHNCFPSLFNILKYLFYLN